jgi:hypothetical protein
MSMRIRELATGVALLLPTGCRNPTADVTTAPGPGDKASADAALPTCQATPAPKPRPGSSEDREAPVVVGARFVTRDRVQLTFSESVAPTTQVNPRQFRLSMAYSTIDYGAGYASGYYYDLAGGDSYQPSIVVTSLAGYDDQPEVLTLQLSAPVPIDLCEGILDTRTNMGGGDPAAQARVGLFLHYTSRGSVGVRDLADNAMSDMGGEWALHFGARHKSLNGGEPIMRLDLLVELGCPEETMGVSAPPGPS